jgi:hypothetical protein
LPSTLAPMKMPSLMLVSLFTESDP